MNMDHSGPILAPLTAIPTSPSYIYPTTSIPTTPSLLSRSNSASRLRTAQSRSQSRSNVPSASTSSRSLYRPASHTSTHNSGAPIAHDVQKRRQHNRAGNKLNSASTGGGQEDRDWLVRTASALTLSRLEEKGQSWLAARESSTSLTADADDEYTSASPSPEYLRSQFVSARNSRSKLTGAGTSRRASASTGHITFPIRHEEDVVDTAEAYTGPDFVNPEDEAELYEARSNDDNDEPNVDEGEMKRVVMGRVGGWVDWAVGWMDIQEDIDDEDDTDSDEHAHRHDSRNGPLDVSEVERRLRLKKKADENVPENDGLLVIDPPPEGRDAGLVSDAKWLLGVASRVAL